MDLSEIDRALAVARDQLPACAANLDAKQWAAASYAPGQAHALRDTAPAMCLFVRREIAARAQGEIGG